jgi:hypothetical protein
MANGTDVLQPLRLILRPYPPLCFLVFPTLTARCLHARNDARDPSNERLNYVGERFPEFSLNGDFHAT